MGPLRGVGRWGLLYLLSASLCVATVAPTQPRSRTKQPKLPSSATDDHATNAALSSGPAVTAGGCVIPQGFDAVPPIIRSLHAASAYANASALAVGGRAAPMPSSSSSSSSSSSFAYSAATTSPFDDQYSAGMRSLTRLNSWSSDALMAECYGKANVWRGVESSLGKGSSSPSAASTAAAAAASGQAGIMAVDTLSSMTNIAAGLSRDLVRLQESYSKLKRKADLLVLARGKLTGRLLVDFQ
jgi:hypothetical protein